MNICCSWRQLLFLLHFLLLLSSGLRYIWKNENYLKWYQIVFCGFFVGWNKCYVCFAVLPWTLLVQHQDKWWHLSQSRWFTDQAKLPHPTLLPKILWKATSVSTSLFQLLQHLKSVHSNSTVPTFVGLCRSKVRCHVRFLFRWIIEQEVQDSMVTHHIMIYGLLYFFLMM